MVKRYGWGSRLIAGDPKSARGAFGVPDIVPVKNGDYVLFEDYERLRLELEALKKELECKN